MSVSFLKAYVFSEEELTEAGYLRREAHTHGIVHTDMGTVLMSMIDGMDPEILAEASDVFRLKINELYRNRRR